MNICGWQVIPEPEIPRTNGFTVILPFDRKLKKYDRESYSPQLTDGRASCPEVDQVLSQIEAVRTPIEFQLRITNYLFLFPLYPILIAVPIILINDPDPDFASSASTMVYLAIAFFVLLFTAVFRIIYFQNKLQNDWSDILKYEINPKFASRKLRWNVSKEWPYWAEIHNDYLKYGSARQPTATQPSANQKSGISSQNTGGQLQTQIYQAEPENSTNLYIPPSQH